MKDYASRMDWYEGQTRTRGWLRWALLGAFVVVVIIAFAVNHHKKTTVKKTVVAQKAVAPTNQKVQFDFYHMLTKNNGEKIAPAASAPVTAAATTPATTVKTPKVAQQAASSNYLISLGSYKTAAAAQNQKASLILSGVSPDDLSVNHSNGKTYDVQLGPFKTKIAAQRRAKVLSQQNVKGVIVASATK